MKLFAIALVISMIAGTWSVGGENVLARETTTSKTDEEIHDTGTVENKTQEVDNTEVAFQNLEDNQEQFTGFAGGDGSEENPYQISTSEMFREMEEYQEQYFVLISDLDLSDSPRINFEGTFDGNGYTIETGFSEENGMFNKVGDTSVVKNCTINIGNGYYSSLPAEYFGAVALQNNGLIKKCIVSGSVVNTTAAMTSGDISIGSVCSTNYGTIEKCRSDVDYSVRVNIGPRFMISGICNNGKVDQCLNTGNINAQVQRNIPRSGIFHNLLSGVGCLSATNECANTGNISLDFSSFQTSSSSIYNYAGFISSYEFTSYAFVVPSKMEGTNSCYISEDVQFSFSTYNLGSGGGVNSKSTVLYADDVTGTQVKTEDEILEWWDSVFADDEDDGGETWVPDGAFSISKSGAWVSGKECALYGTYSASTPGNAETEAEEIVWSSSDPSILDVSDTIIDFNIADAENNHVSIQKSFTANKAGTVTITATASDGRSESITVDIEPELIAVGSEEYIKTDTSVVLCRMTLDEPNADYLETIISGVELIDSSDSENVFEITDMYYKISEDETFAELICDIKPVTSGKTTFQLSTIGGQKASITLTSGLFSLENDIWSFINASNYFGNNSEGIFITSDDYNRFTSHLENTERALLTFDDGSTLYNVDGNSQNHIQWPGSCVGMSTWVILNNNGILKASDIEGKQYLSDYSLTADKNTVVESAINYYIGLQNLPVQTKPSSDFSLKAQKEQITELSEMVNNISKGGNLVFLGYKWYSKFDNAGKADTRSGSSHVVVAYGMETGDYTDFVYDTMPKERRDYIKGEKFDHRILIYDPNDSDRDPALDFYFSENSSVWCIPKYGIISTTSQSRDEESNNGMLSIATTDLDIINAVDYNTGEVSQLMKEMRDQDVFSITSLACNDYSIRWASGSADISGFSVLNSTSDEQISVIPISGITAEGDTGITGTTVYIPESENCTVSSNENLGFRMYSGDYLIAVEASSSGNIDFFKSGGAELHASDPTQYSIRITANEGYYSLPWYQFEIMGENASEISAEWADEGILITGDNLENVTVIGSNDDNTQEMAFSTEEDSVLISESDNELTVLIDTDNDGVYDTDVNEEHIHEYGIPEFVWGEDYKACTAVFTCEDGDDEKKIECDINSETTDPICTEDGKTVYTATVFFADQEYTDTQEEVIPATGHTYEYIDNGDGTHTKVCTAGDDTATEPHTYQDGICTYCGAEEPKEHVHEYGTPEFKWSEDYTTCTMVFTCKDGDDQQSIECEVTDEITDATCTENGKAVYTAKGTFDGKEYIDVKEVEIPASGHAYGTPEFNWSEDYQTCTAVFNCESCDDEQKIECDITSETTDPTCTEDGKTLYTATVSFADKEYTDTQEDVIPATGHTYEYTDNGDGTHKKVCTAGDDTASEPHTYQDGTCTYCGAEEPEGHTHKYGEPKFTWSDDYSSCTATFTCADGDDQQIVDCAVTAKDNGDGTVSYTAVAEFNGESYTAEQVVDIQDEADEKPEIGKPTESGDNNNSGNSTDVNEGSSDNKTSEESASNVQTGDDSILILWSLLIASMISAGVIVLLIRRKYTK